MKGLHNKFIAIPIYLLSWLVTSCTQIDNYMLGKDNTPKPSALEAISNKVKLTNDWSLNIGKANKFNRYLKLKPVIRQNIIYTASAFGTVKAINTNTGGVIWSKELNTNIVSGPTVNSGSIALTTHTADMIILNVANGEQKWSAKMSSEALSKPVIYQNEVIVKTIDGNLYAYQLQNGTKIWAMDHGSPNLILKASSSPVIMGNLALVGFSDGRLDAVELDTGRVLWQRSIAYASGSSDVERLVDIDADPILEDNRVYLTTYQGYIGALSLTDEQFIWRKPASVYKNMAMDANNLYVTDSNDVMWAFSKRDGQVQWKQLSLKARGLTEPVLMGQWLIVGDKTGFIHVISSKNGELIGRLQLSGAVDVAPAVLGNNLYVVTNNGKLSRVLVRE